MQTSMMNETCPGGLTGYNTLGHFNAISKKKLIHHEWKEERGCLGGTHPSEVRSGGS